ncbi:hypothetical protein [Streptomyces lincolnensis]|uniref:hypothetical protein n=1 Tax=Streptomyces lincolnensis TaxID=1915 RepID=UPI0008317763|nr:hypothetical protein [Streptomyces lincolnensis]QMV07588.1 hypothetical protein GJU35_19170 [Streptomyces lincolnensis]
MPARPARLRLLAATAAALAALTLTGCEDGEGLRDEGPSATSLRSPAPHNTEKPRPPELP